MCAWCTNVMLPQVGHLIQQIAPNAFIFDSKKHPNILENDMR